MRNTFRQSALIALPLFLLMLFHRPAQAVVVTDGLIHYWNLDETSGNSMADSIGSWNLEIQNGAILGATGIQGKGVFLDGVNDFLTTTTAAPNFTDSNFTISLWVKWTSVAGGKYGVLNVQGLQIDLSTPDIKPSAWSAGGLAMASSTTIDDGLWHLLSFVRDGTNGSIYLDATQIATGSGNIAPVGSIAALEIGKVDVTHFFSGTIDDIAIYNRALSSAEIALNAVPEPTPLLLLTLALPWLTRFRHRHN